MNVLEEQGPKTIPHHVVATVSQIGNAVNFKFKHIGSSLINVPLVYLPNKLRLPNQLSELQFVKGCATLYI